MIGVCHFGMDFLCVCVHMITACDAGIPVIYANMTDSRHTLIVDRTLAKHTHLMGKNDTRDKKHSTFYFVFFGCFS